MRSRRKGTRAKTPRMKKEKVEISSGNVFADLGFEDSEERLLKAKLASQIAQSAFLQKSVRRKSRTPCHDRLNSSRKDAKSSGVPGNLDKTDCEIAASLLRATQHPSGVLAFWKGGELLRARSKRVEL